MTLAVYCTREDVKAALDSMETARNNAQVDRAIRGGAEAVEGALNRIFYPLVATRSFPWPNQQYARPWRLWLDQHELISATSIVTGGTTLAPTDYFLEPVNTGPPYTHVEINLASRAAFDVGSTYQRDIVIAGVYGYKADEEPAGALAEALDTTEIGVDVTDVSNIGVGSILRVDTERMIVTGKSLLTTGQTVQTTALTASAANDQVAVTTGTGFTADEVITIDSERMRIVDIAGNTLIVKRAWDGSVLAAHNTGVTIYAPRTLTVVRGALGTTAAAHNTATALVKHSVPGLVRDLNIAEALVRLGLETSGYARTQTRGEPGKPVTASLEDVRDQAFTAHGRKNRSRAV